MFCQKHCPCILLTLQRDTYSGQKKHNLVKPMVICATDGHIVDIPGPYQGRNNDASMTNHIVRGPAAPVPALQPVNQNVPGPSRTARGRTQANPPAAQPGPSQPQPAPAQPAPNPAPPQQGPQPATQPGLGGFSTKYVIPIIRQLSCTTFMIYFIHLYKS